MEVLAGAGQNDLGIKASESVGVLSNWAIFKIFFLCLLCVSYRYY